MCTGALGGGGLRAEATHPWLRLLQAAEDDMYVASVGDRLTIKLGPRFDMGGLVPKVGRRGGVVGAANVRPCAVALLHHATGTALLGPAVRHSPAPTCAEGGGVEDDGLRPRLCHLGEAGLNGHLQTEGGLCPAAAASFACLPSQPLDAIPAFLPAGLGVPPR